MSFFKMLFTIALPIILQNFLSSLVNMLDTIMVGQLGAVEIAAVGLGNQIFFLLSMFLFGTVSGGSIFIAQFWGKKDIDGIHSTMGITILLSTVISVLFFIASFFFPEICLSFYTNDAELIEKGASYLKTVSFSYLFFGICFAFEHAERSTERVKLPMIATTVSVIINAILNWLFIFGVSFGGTTYISAMGITGAAVATIASRAVECGIAVIMPYIRKYEIAASLKKYFTIPTAFIPKYIRICLPVLLNETLWGLGISIQNGIFAHAGTDVIAAFNITGTVSNCLWPFCIGCGSACAIILGKKIGETRYDEARSLSKKIIFFLMGSGFVLGLMLIPLTKLLPLVFNVEAVVIHMATVFLMMKACTYGFDAFNMGMIVGVCRSGGDTVYGLFMDIGFMWTIALPLGFLAVNIWHLPYWAIYMCILSETFCKFFMGLVRLMRGKWLRNVTE